MCQKTSAKSAAKSLYFIFCAVRTNIYEPDADMIACWVSKIGHVNQREGLIVPILLTSRRQNE